MMYYILFHYQTIQVDIDVKSPNLIIPEYGSMDRKGHRLVVDLGSLRVNSDLQKGYTALEVSALEFCFCFLFYVLSNPGKSFSIQLCSTMISQMRCTMLL